MARRSQRGIKRVVQIKTGKNVGFGFKRSLYGR